MRKSKMAELIETLVAEIILKSGDTLDAGGARAVLAMAIKKNHDNLLAAALPICDLAKATVAA